MSNEIDKPEDNPLTVTPPPVIIEPVAPETFEEFLGPHGDESPDAHFNRLLKSYTELGNYLGRVGEAMSKIKRP